MSAWIWSARALPLLGVLRLVVHLCQLRAAVQRDPAHQLAGHEVLRLPAHLPDAAVGLLPVRGGRLDLPLEHRPQRLRQLVAGPGVQVDRVQHRTPHVVLALPVGTVPDPHRVGALVARQVRQRLLVQLALTAHAVHHLQVVAVATAVGHEVEEVVGLPVEAQRVQPPQREGRVPDPGVAVVPVALALRGLRQRGGRRRQQRTGRGVGQALQGQRAALQVAAPRVVREVAQRDPLPPVLGGAAHPLVGLGQGARRGQRRPGQRDEVLVALDHPGPCVQPGALDPRPEVGGQPQGDVDALGAGQHRAVPLALVAPLRLDPAVVEHRLAGHRQVDRAAHTLHRAQQAVLGVEVGGRPAVRAGPLLDVVPRPHGQGVPHDEPPGAGLPGRLQHQAAGQVPPRGRHHLVVRADPERAGTAVEQRGEDARRVRARQAHPLDRAAGCHQAVRLAVGQEGEVGDRREGAVPGQPLGSPGLVTRGFVVRHAEIVAPMPPRRQTPPRVDLQARAVRASRSAPVAPRTPAGAGWPARGRRSPAAGSSAGGRRRPPGSAPGSAARRPPAAGS